LLLYATKNFQLLGASPQTHDQGTQLGAQPSDPQLLSPMFAIFPEHMVSG